MLLLLLTQPTPGALAARRPRARLSLKDHGCIPQCRAAQLQPGRLQQAHVFWDLDNLNPRDSEHALVMGSRLKRSAQRLTGLPSANMGLTAYANELTVGALLARGGSQPWEAVLELLDGQLVVAGLEKDAADLFMRHDMLRYADQHGPAAAIVCVSNDQGFAPALRRCSTMGAYTVAVGAYLKAAGINWAAPPRELPVPQAANCIVAFHPGKALQKSRTELKLAEKWKERCGADWQPSVSRKAHKGVCLSFWENSGQQQLQADAAPRA